MHTSCADCLILKKCIFGKCSHHELQSIDFTKSIQTYEKNECIFEENRIPSSLYCIQSGQVKIYKKVTHHNQFLFRIAKKGDIIGYSYLLTEAPYTISAVAMEQCKIAIIPRNIVLDLLDKNSAFMHKYLELLSVEFNYTIEVAGNFAYKPVMGRLAQALLFLSKTCKNEYNPLGTIQITRRDLASFTGTVKETVIRILKKFKQDKTIEISKKGITILDPEKLVFICELYQ